MSFLKLAMVFRALPEIGGAFTHESAVAEKMPQILEGLGWASSSYFASSSAFHRLGEEPRRPSKRIFRRSVAPVFEELLVQDGIDLVLFLSATRRISEIRSIPFIGTIWDIGHRDLPEFPEFGGRDWAIREDLFRNHIPRAFHMLTDSDHTGERLELLYGVDSTRWTTIGLHFPSNLQGDVSPRVRDAALGGNFFFYPAQKWPHKNHAVILEALKLGRLQGLECRLILSGAEAGYASVVNDLVTQLGLVDAVTDLGFIGANEVEYLTARANAVLMPSFLGPTNLPPLQALSLGTPAIVSDSHIFPPKVLDRCVVVGVEDTQSWSQALLEFSTKRRVKPVVWDVNFEERMSDILRKFERRRANWK